MIQIQFNSSAHKISISYLQEHKQWLAPTPQSQALVHRSIDKYSKHIWEAQYETNAWYTNTMHEYDQEPKKMVKYTKWHTCNCKVRRGGAQLKNKKAHEELNKSLDQTWKSSKANEEHPRTQLSTMRKILIEGPKWIPIK